jgi:hypothetical protein
LNRQRLFCGNVYTEVSKTTNCFMVR